MTRDPGGRIASRFLAQLVGELAQVVAALDVAALQITESDVDRKRKLVASQAGSAQRQIDLLRKTIEQKSQ